MTLDSEQLANAKQLAGLVIEAGLPDIEESMPPLQVSLLRQDEAINELVEAVRHKAFRSNQYKDRQLRNIRLIMASFILAAFHHQHLALSTRIRKNSYLDRIGLTRRHIENIVGAMCSLELCTKTRDGFKHEKYPELSKATQYYVTPKLIRTYCKMLYATVGDFDSYDAYVYEENVAPWENDWKSKEQTLRTYNEFMRSSSWAFKAPTVRKLGAVPHTSGRVYTQYQNITNRRIPLRTQTLLNGRRVAEVDFASNHLTMLSMLLDRPISEDPYTDVAQLVGSDRATVKQVFVPLLGASKRSAIGQIKWKLRYKASGELVDAIIDGFERVIPWLGSQNLLLNNVGTRLQYLEGEIALKMFDLAIAEEIPIINIHDAYACTPNNGAIVHNAMHHFREEVINEWKGRVL